MIDPVFNLSLLQAIEWIRLGCIFISLFGVLLPLLSLRSSSITMAIFGLILIFSGFAGGFVCMYAHSELSKDRPYQVIPGKTFNTSEYQPISSLSDGQVYSMSGGGSFFLGIGSISVNGQTTPQYVFYKNLPDGYQLGTLPAANVIIREDATRTTSKIEWVYQHTISDKTEYMDNNETVGGGESMALIKTYIHVPDGTVKIQYDLDSKLGDQK